MKDQSVPAALTRSFRGLFPFRIAATSYVFPAGWAENARLLGPVVDEIQILLFESVPASLPLPAEIDELKAVAAETGVVYSVHLPLDIYLGTDSNKIRKQGVDAVMRILEATAVLNPRVYIAHLEHEGANGAVDDIGAWQDNCRRSLDAFGAKQLQGINLAVENLDYPFEWAEPLIAEFGLKVCVDVGHLVMGGIDPAAFLEANRHRAAMVHLYGNPGPGQHRHLALDQVPRATLDHWLRLLQDFRETVCLEVFNPADLAASLTYLEGKRLSWMAGQDKM